MSGALWGRMQRSLWVGSLVLVLVAWCPIAEAQAATPLTASTAQADAAYVRDVGAGLTIGGIGLTGLGVGLMLGIHGWEDWSGVIVGGLFEGLGGLAALIGIPTWIAGGVRADVLSRSDDERAEIGWRYELAGIVTTLTSIACTLVGGALLAASYGLSQSSHGPDDDDLSRQLLTAGGALVPIGAYVALFLGVPIWAEGARF